MKGNDGETISFQFISQATHEGELWCITQRTWRHELLQVAVTRPIGSVGLAKYID